MILMALVAVPQVGQAAPPCTFVQGIISGAPHPNGGGWVHDTAKVAATAYVGPESEVCKHAQVSGNTTVSGSAIYDHVTVSGSAVIRNSFLAGNAGVSGNARVIDAYVWDSARVSGDAKVMGGAWVHDNAEVSGTAIVRRSAIIAGKGKVDCGRWANITVTTDRTGQCGRNGGGGPDLGLLSNPADPGNVQTAD